MVGKAEVGVMVIKPLPTEKSASWVPAIALELMRNWRRLPCCNRPVEVPSSSVALPRPFVIALNEKP
jgi:hypothetical protein